jgi:hypothetical protein
MFVNANVSGSGCVAQDRLRSAALRDLLIERPSYLRLAKSVSNFSTKHDCLGQDQHSADVLAKSLVERHVCCANPFSAEFFKVGGRYDMRVGLAKSFL